MVSAVRSTPWDRDDREAAMSEKLDGTQGHYSKGYFELANIYILVIRNCATVRLIQAGFKMNTSHQPMIDR